MPVSPSAAKFQEALLPIEARERSDEVTEASAAHQEGLSHDNGTADDSGGEVTIEGHRDAGDEEEALADGGAARTPR